MMDLEFEFDEPAWSSVFQAIPQGGKLSAVEFLTAVEGEDQETLEQILFDLEAREISLDISTLPKQNAVGQAALRLRREEELARSGKLLVSLEENDPLRLYLEEIQSLPKAENVQALAQRFAAGYEMALPMLTNSMLPAVAEQACQLTGNGVLLLDLIQEGSLGLWQGILSYREGDFVEHAKAWSLRYMFKAITLQARENGLGQRMKQAMEDYRAVDEQLLTELGRNPTIEELAEGLHMSLPEAEAVAKMLESARLLQRATPVEEEEKENADEEEQSVENTAYFQMRQRVTELLETLSETDAKLLTLRFGLEGGLPLSPEETGKKLNLTAEEVVAREVAALLKLRKEG